MDQQGQPSGPAGDCKRNHSEKCTGSWKVNCNHSGNWTGKCSENCFGNHTENCKGNCNGNSSGSCPPAAGEPIKSLSVALSLFLLREGGSIWLIAAPLIPKWLNWKAAGTARSPHCCQGWQGSEAALASTREALWAGTCRCWRAALWPSHPGELGDPSAWGLAALLRTMVMASPACLVPH